MRTKKIISALITAALALSNTVLLPLNTMASGEETFTNIYNIEEDIDSGGNWIYRNLLPDEEEMTDTSMLWYNQGSTTGSVGISDDAKVGGKSIYAKKSGYNGFGFEVELLEAGKYITGFYAKGNYDTENIDETDKNVSLYPYYFAENNTSGSYVQKQIKHNSVAAQWGYFSNEFEIKASEISNRNDAKPNAMYFNVFMDKANDVRPTNEVWIDAWTLRRVVPDDFIATEMLAGIYNEENNTITYKFNLDIDPFTIEKEDIAVNGTKGSDYIKSALLTLTNENTREHTLVVELQNLGQDLYNITLPDLKDVWGRSVTGGDAAVIIDTNPEVVQIAAKAFNKRTLTVTYEFTNDVDPDTVKKENIAVNGRRNSNFVKSATLTGTTLTIELQNVNEGNTYTVSLPNLKDVNGQAVEGNSLVTCEIPFEGQYVIDDDLDEDGKWIYRELVHDMGCEALDGFSNRHGLTADSTSQTGVLLSDEGDAYEGSYSLTRKARQGSGIGFKWPAITTEDEFLITAWMKGECNGINTVPVSVVIGYDQMKNSSDGKGVQFDVGNDWTYVTMKVKPAANAAKDTVGGMVSWASSGFQDNKGEYVQKIWVDEWSVRRALPEDFPVTQISIGEFDRENATVKFNFSLDIDPRTVRKKNVKINGEVNEALIKDITISTDEGTRQTTLEIELSSLMPGCSYTMDISSVKDAWGRDIEGEKTLEFSIPSEVDLDETDAIFSSSLVEGEMEIDFDIVNNSTSAQNVKVVAATCKNNVFTGISVKDVTLAAGSNTLSELLGTGNELKITVGEDDEAVHIFVWKNGSVMSPVSKFMEITQSGTEAKGY